LDSGNFVTTLAGTPPPPGIGPFRASLRIYSREDKALVGTVTTDAQGKFQIQLPPGDYRIVPDVMRGSDVLAPGDEPMIIVGRYEAAPPSEISLHRNQYAQVTITYKMYMGN
jgi:hypothetical protein